WERLRESSRSSGTRGPGSPVDWRRSMPRSWVERRAPPHDARTQRSPSARVHGGNHVSPRISATGIRASEFRSCANQVRPPPFRKLGEPPGSPHPSTGSWARGSWPMNVRRAGPDDFEAVAALWREFAEEVPPPEFEALDVEKELGEIAEILASEIAVLAEDDSGGLVGFALGRRRSERYGTLTDLYVSRAARRNGIATDLVREVVKEFAALGVEQLDLDVQTSNAVARSVYAR